MVVLSQREILKNYMRERAVMKDVNVTLASGQASNFYVDCKRVSLHGPALLSLSEVFFEELQKLSPKPVAVAGVSVGGDPIIAGILTIAAQKNWALEGLLVRKEAKKHGLSSGKAVEGARLKAHGPVWLVEDVVSTGGSSLVAAQHLRDEGFRLAGIFCIVDREMGGAQKLAEELKIPVRSLFKKAELV